MGLINNDEIVLPWNHSIKIGSYICLRRTNTVNITKQDNDLYHCHIQFCIFYDKESSHLTPIKYEAALLDLTSTELPDMFTFAYDQIKIKYPNSTDT